jgi:hypothetical protein
MRVQPTFVVTKQNGKGEVFLAPTGYKQSIWRTNRRKATEYNSKTTAQKDAKTHGGEVKQVEKLPQPPV